MKPVPFRYLRAASVADAVEALAAAGGEGKIIAGGQSLMPMMNFRLVRPEILVDINAIQDLDRIEEIGDRLRIGALVRHRMTASDALVAEHAPVLREAMKSVAHLTVRNRGTFCGSLCHADPAAEVPMVALLLNAEVEIASSSGGRRLASRDFIVGPLANALGCDEMVTAVTIEKLPSGAGWGFAEFSRRHGDFALAALAATMRRREGVAHDVRIAVMGLGDTAARMARAEERIEGSTPDEASIADAIALIRADVEPMSDLAASSDYRRHLVGELAGNVLREAWSRAEERATA
ncbi:MAG TPA: xanthine dehydrogenase family protein subunit M [Novosphingobium sp.]|nr:xanthine dehydrogenase family protein subunit M [Novosphingobium sp.]